MNSSIMAWLRTTSTRGMAQRVFTRQLHSATAQLERFKIYTKTGDKGTSALLNGERRPKFDACFEAVGTVDELSSALGISLSHTAQDTRLAAIQDQLTQIQCQLQEAGSSLTTPFDDSSSPEMKERVAFDPSYEPELEQWIDAHDESLPPLTNFILPSGGAASASLHHARTICRRAERRAVELAQVQAVQPEVLRYLNRLSDVLFTLARVCCQAQEHTELVYRPATKRREAKLKSTNE
eukprot:TRINITY_DN8500_c0_g1_i1.p1 TRINITY_DN8500_c0_g1~~TRINITY_DN8500_c0_g1_i1.p1  ORF type:complete len:238 (+),score=35.42 TRINITY_DN8500_c0_g1_i1:901-1614(+)